LECLDTIEDPNASEVPQFISKHCGKNKGGINNAPVSATIVVYKM
jgi:hypothetical protein